MGGRCDLSGSAVLPSGASEGLPGRERERKDRGCKWYRACSQQLHWQEDYRIKLYICLQGPLGCFLICLTLEGTGKVEASEVGLSCPELVTSSVSCSPEMKVALSLVAVRDFLEPCTVISLPPPHPTPQLSHSKPWA